MKKRFSLKKILAGFVTAISLSSCANLGEIAETGLQVSQALGYTPAQMGQGVKDMLSLSSERTTNLLGATGGFSNNARFRISLPSSLDPVVQPMRSFGLGGYIDNVEELMNRGAEMAAKEAAPMFLKAVQNMTVDDALGIIRGDNSAATQYFRAQTEQQLTAKYETILQSQLSQIGFYGDYKSLLSAYKLLPLADKPDLDLEKHALNRGLNAIFTQMAEEEANIRANPVERGSALLGALLK